MNLPGYYLITYLITGWRLGSKFNNQPPLVDNHLMPGKNQSWTQPIILGQGWYESVEKP
jgi:hypothetical protein